MIRHLDDTKQVADYQRQGATVVKGSARLAGRNYLHAAEQLDH